MLTSAKTIEKQWVDEEDTDDPLCSSTASSRSAKKTKCGAIASPQKQNWTGGSPLLLLFLVTVITCMFSFKISSLVSISDSSTTDTLFSYPTNQKRTPGSNQTALSFDPSTPNPTIPSADTPQTAFPPHTALFNVSNIPKFMLEYFEWHGRQLQKLQSGALSWTPSSDKEIAPNSPIFMIMRCIDGDRCGGTSDRLKAFPLFILLAKQSNRVLLIRWGRRRPFYISAFLKPGPLWNWTVPEPLLRLLEDGDDGRQIQKNMTISNTAKMGKGLDAQKGGRSSHQRVYHDGTKFKALRQDMLDPSIWVVEGNDYTGGATRYQNIVNEALAQQPGNSSWRPEDANYESFYHDLFHASFLPSPAIEKMLLAYVDRDTTSNEISSDPSLPVRMQLNGYMVAHYRAKYPREPYRETWNVSVLEHTAIHAVDCARNRSSSKADAVYFASDTALAVQAIYKQYSLHEPHNPNGSSDDIYVWSYLNLQYSDVTQNEGETPNATIPFATDPPHLNFANLNDPSGFYGIFVDLFLMSYSTCVVYGAGGFGRFGSLVSFQPKCGSAFTKQGGVLQQCERYIENWNIQE
jgi:hypothetical protein